MKVQKRGTDVKRHTLKWKIGGKWISRPQAYELARAGRIEGVTACRGQNGRYIQSLPGSPNLYDLPVVVKV